MAFSIALADAPSSAEGLNKVVCRFISGETTIGQGPSGIIYRTLPSHLK